MKPQAAQATLHATVRPKASVSNFAVALDVKRLSVDGPADKCARWLFNLFCYDITHPRNVIFLCVALGLLSSLALRRRMA